MKKVILIVSMLFVFILSNSTTILAEGLSDEIVPYAQMGACPACGYSSAVVTGQKTDPWTVVGYTGHNGHQDRIESTNRYTYIYCPNCGKTTVSVDPLKRQICP